MEFDQLARAESAKETTRQLEAENSELVKLMSIARQERNSAQTRSEILERRIAGSLTALRALIAHLERT